MIQISHGGGGIRKMSKPKMCHLLFEWTLVNKEDGEKKMWNWHKIKNWFWSDMRNFNQTTIYS